MITGAAHSTHSFFPSAACVRALPALCLLWLAFGNISAAQTWTLSWSDEFNGAPNSPINPANWTYDSGSLMVNDEVEYYCVPGSSTPPCVADTPNAYIDGSGHLVIQAIKISSSVAPYSNSWTSARLNTSGNLQNFQYGRLESSMTLPVGAGIWPAYWALGNNINTVGWPMSGEIDFMENVPPLGPSTIQSTIHGGNSSSSCYCGGNGLGKPYPLPGGSTVTSFHTYGGIWSPNMIQFYVDNPANIFFVVTASDLPSGQPWDFNHPFFLLLNLAVGGTGSWPGPPDSSTPNPAVMTVDYVRWYKPSTRMGPTMTASPISLTAGAGSGTVSLSSTSGTGRVFLSCTTTAPNASCSIKSADALNPNTLDFSNTGSGSATVSVTTAGGAAGTQKAQKRGIPGSGVSKSWNSPSQPSHWLLMANLLMLSGFVWASFVSLPGWNRGLRRGLGGNALMLALLMHPGCGSGNNTSSGGGGGTGYTVTVNAFTVSSNGNPDSTLTIPVSVN
ncbi:MAG: glycoside hydrolase family 16 protein [Candidatus Sulfotelmatobacter sp.]